MSRAGVALAGLWLSLSVSLLGTAGTGCGGDDDLSSSAQPLAGDACELPATSVVVIHELMITPGTADPVAGQWIELYNPGATLLDLTGWSLTTSDGQAHVLAPAPGSWFVLHPGAALVLARSADSTANGGVDTRSVYGADLALLPVGAQTQTLTLRDGEGAIVDAVALDAATWPIEVGRSVALSHPHADNHGPESWRASGHAPAPEANTTYGNAGLLGSPWKLQTSAHAALPDPGCGEAGPCLLMGCGLDGACVETPDPGCCDAASCGCPEGTWLAGPPEAPCQPYVVAGFVSAVEGSCEAGTEAAVWHTCERDAGNAGCDPEGGKVWSGDCGQTEMGPLDACRCAYGEAVVVAAPTGGSSGTGCPVFGCGHGAPIGGPLLGRCGGSPTPPPVTIVDGDDWSLPPWVGAAPGSGLYTWALDPEHPELAIRRFDVSWRQLHPAPGQLDLAAAGQAQGMELQSFEAQREAPGDFWMRVFTSGVDWAPEWVADDCGVAGFGADAYGQEHLPIWDPCVWGHLRDLYALVFADGALAADPRLRFIYVPGGFGWAELDLEVLGPAVDAGLTVETLAAWVGVMATDLVAIFGEHAHKLVFTGEDYPYSPFDGGDELLAHDVVAAGLGVRNGIPENFNDHLNHAPAYGASITPDGRVSIDETWVADLARIVGMENECYDGCGLGPQSPEMLAYGVRMSLLKALQLRATHLYASADASGLDVFPELWRWARLSLGRHRADAPDAWVALREAVDGYWQWDTTHDWLTRPWVKNTGRWLAQRDIAPDGVSRRGETIVEGDLFAAHADRITYEGRRTNIEAGQRALYLDLDPVLGAGLGAFDLRVTYVDAGGPWRLEYAANGCTRASEPVVPTGSGELRTASIALSEASLDDSVRGLADLRISALGADDIEIHFVRVVRRCPLGFSGESCNTPPAEATPAGFELVWSDEFNGPALDLARWQHQLGDGSQLGIPGWGNGELQWYQPDNASVAGGALTIEARAEPTGPAYTSSRLRTVDAWGHGRVEARVRTPEGQGSRPSGCSPSPAPGLTTERST